MIIKDKGFISLEKVSDSEHKSYPINQTRNNEKCGKTDE